MEEEAVVYESPCLGIVEVTLGKRKYEAPCIEILEVEMEQLIAGTIRSESGAVSDTMIDGGTLGVDDGNDDTDSNNDIEW